MVIKKTLEKIQKLDYCPLTPCYFIIANSPEIFADVGHEIWVISAIRALEMKMPGQKGGANGLNLEVVWPFGQNIRGISEINPNTLVYYRK